MDAKENSKEQDQYTSPYLLSYPSITLFTPNTHMHSTNLYPMFSTMEFNVLNNARANTNIRGNSNFFAPCKGYSDVPPLGEHSFENYSDSDSSSEVDGDASDEEACLDELLYDGKAKEKIEQLAAIVGVDTKEPAVVLTEVVRILKQFKRIN